jgi:hypothetical protein
MKSFPTLIAFLLLAAAGPLAAQSPAPQPSAPQPPATPSSQPPERKAAGERPLNLNLKLDDASRHRIMSGSTEEKPGGEALPSLGGDARKLGPLRSDPYPPSSDRIP